MPAWTSGGASSPAWTGKKKAPVTLEEPEAPFLTHQPGPRFALSPPDNNGQRRQPIASTSEPPSLSPSPPVPVPKKTKKKKAKRKAPVVDPEVILEAVVNAGRPSSSLRPEAGSRAESWETLRPESAAGADETRPALALGAPSTRPRTAARRPQGRGHSVFGVPDADADAFPDDRTSPPPAYPALLPSPTPPPSQASSSPSESFHTPERAPSPPPPPPPLPAPPSFVFSDTDPFVLAWEADRAAGLDLEARIARDLERRSSLPTTALGPNPDPIPISPRRASQNALSNSPVPDMQPQDDVRELGREIAQAEADKDAPRVARALSIYAGRKFAAAAERRLSNSRARLDPAGSLDEGWEDVGQPTRSAGEVPVGSSFMTDGLLSPLAENAEDVHEQDESEGESEVDEAPARSASADVDARRRFAEAAERRMAAARAQVSVQVVVEEDHAPVDAANRPSSTVSTEFEPAVVEVSSTSPFPVRPFGQLHTPTPSTTSRSPTTDLVTTPLRPSPPAAAPSTPFPVRPFGSSASPSFGSSTAPLFTSTNNPLRFGLPNVATRPAEVASPTASAIASPPPASSLSSPPAPGLQSPLQIRPTEATAPVRRPPTPPPSRTHIAEPTRSPPPPAPAGPTLAPRPERRSRPLSLSTNLTPSMLSYIAPSERDALIAPLEPDRPDDTPTTPTSGRHWRAAPPPPTQAVRPEPLSPSTPVARSSPRAVADSQIPLRPFRPLPVPPAATDRVDAFTLLGGVAPLVAQRAPLESPTNEARPRPPSASSSFEAPGGDSPEVERENVGHRPPLADGSDEYVYTDLDLLLARLEESEGGTNYDDLLLVGEMIGQVQSAGCSSAEIESLPYAPVELVSRRVDKQGRVKQKLSVVGVRCIDCNVCLARFRVNDLAVALPKCLHCFHAGCIQAWLRRNRNCPICREEVVERLNVEL